MQQRYTASFRGKGEKVCVRDHRADGDICSHVNPIRSKTKKKTMGRPGPFSGRSLEAVGNSSPR